MDTRTKEQAGKLSRLGIKDVSTKNLVQNKRTIRGQITSPSNCFFKVLKIRKANRYVSSKNGVKVIPDTQCVGLHECEVRPSGLLPGR